MYRFILFVISLSVWQAGVWGFPEDGKWFVTLDEHTSGISIPKSLFGGSQIFIEIVCKAETLDTKIKIDWFLMESLCYDELNIDFDQYSDPGSIKDNKTIAQELTTNCSGIIRLNQVRLFGGKGPPLETSEGYVQAPQALPVSGNESQDSKGEVRSFKKGSHPQHETSAPVFVVPKDGFYLLGLKIKGTNFKADVQIEMLSEKGYLSAVDWPLYPFYGVMCVVYVVFGLVWLIVSFCQWRELLRIQFWIGGVILLGMLEKAAFYAEYQNINSSGCNIKTAIFLTELVSCAKRTLARMLVIIVSLGFGIVKPRLGSMLHRLVGVGICYFVLAAVESYIQLGHPKKYPSNQLLMASIALALLDSSITSWIFTSLFQTMKTLQLRRNLVKLSLYRHFTNTLIFAILSSVVFTLYYTTSHHFDFCRENWQYLWLGKAFWHILFSVILLVIMILWRPTNNNQRYAFTPLLDAAEDDEEEDQFVNDAYGVKMRTHSRPTSPKPKPGNDDDVLKWVDENIPSAGAGTALPMFDSEEELLTTKYEMSKMQ